MNVNGTIDNSFVYAEKGAGRVTAIVPLPSGDVMVVRYSPLALMSIETDGVNLYSATGANAGLKLGYHNSVVVDILLESPQKL